VFFRRRVVVTFVAAALAAIAILSGAAIGWSGGEAAPVTASADSRLEEVVRSAMLTPDAGGAPLTIEDLRAHTRHRAPNAQVGKVLTLRAACAGTGSVLVRLTDGLSQSQTRVSCARTAAERRAIELRPRTAEVFAELATDQGTSGLVGTQFMDGPVGG
jgi:hypothetical protein